MKNPGIVVLTGFGMLAIGMGLGKLANAMEPSIETEYMNTTIFRSVTDPKMAFYWFVPFITAGLMLWIWNLAKHRIKGYTYSSKGLNFGLIYWAVTIPGMIMSYCTFQLSGAIVVSWAISNLAEAIFAGVVYARFRP
ncbi:hypothetical protein CNR22_01590 [Sphingobacteriaceae bacterium]|nr:hypothetical protein CNR22_01590 [Sphingobacteriaceae bacterium]